MSRSQKFLYAVLAVLFVGFVVYKFVDYEPGRRRPFLAPWFHDILASGADATPKSPLRSSS